MEHFYKDRRVLVAGAAGFIGENLVPRLLSLGANVTGLIHKKQPATSHVSKNLTYISGDLTRLEDCERATKDIDLVFMLAANSSGAAVIEKYPLTHLTPNLVMNTQMMAAAYANRVDRFIFTSSNTVYPLTDKAVEEEDVTGEFFDKYHIVASMKLFSEKLCEIYNEMIESPMSALVVRPGNLYGPFDKFSWKESKVVPALIRKALEKRSPFEVWGDGKDIKDFLYIDDFCEALLRYSALAKPPTPVNIASGKPISLREMIPTILDAADLNNAKIVYDTEKPTMIPKRLISIKKISDLIEWEPKVDIEEGIKKTVNWYREFFKEISPEDLK